VAEQLKELKHLRITLEIVRDEELRDAQAYNVRIYNKIRGKNA
jgi:hypothetical protein